jgi:folate-binding protein YgfZ
MSGSVALDVKIEIPKAFVAPWSWKPLRLKGADQEKFLSGVVTNTVKGMKENDANFSFTLTVKGRIITEFFLCKEKEDFLLWSPRGSEEALWGHLDHYHVLEDISFAWDDGVGACLVGGSELAAYLTLLGLSLPEEGKGAVWESGGGRVNAARLSRMEGLDLVLCWGEEATILGFRDRLFDRQWASLDEKAWGAVAFGLGWAESPSELKDLLIHEAKLEESHVNFKKGCFIGQEVVARTQWRGRATKGLFLLGTEAGLPPLTPSEALLQDAEGTEIGKVLRQAPLPDGRLAIRALLRLQAVQDQSEIVLVTQPNAAPLPLRLLNTRISL